MDRSRTAAIFGLDLRSLAAFRIGLAGFVICDLFLRGFDLTAHYTDDGVVPRSILSANLWHPAVVSIHMLTGSAAGIALIFLIHGLAAAALLVGYRTRLMTFIVWLLTASLHSRNPLILNGGDDLARVLLFFAIFLPLGARYSLDAASRSAGTARSNLFVSPATAVYYLQFIAVYFFAALLKSGPEWRTEGTAIYYALNLDQLTLPLGHALLNYPELLRLLTFAVWWLELLGGFILLIPGPAAKLAAILVLSALQFGFALTLAIGHFPWVNIIAMLPFLPAFLWAKLAPERHTIRTSPRPESRWVNGLAMAFFAMVLINNLAPLVPLKPLNDLLEAPLMLTRLDEYWGMFAPSPTKEDGWYVVEGRLRTGTVVDAFRGTTSIDYGKPNSAAGFYPNERWRKFMMNIWLRDYKEFRAPLARYLCRQWNGKHAGTERLAQVTITFNLEMTPPPGEAATVQKLTLGNYPCLSE